MNKKHGMKNTREYKAWILMKARCYNENNNSFQHYGAKGIQVCTRWKNSFENFYKDMGDKPTPKHSLGRKDNNKNYSASNCAWETLIEQANNKSNNRMITYKRRKQSLATWCRELNIPYGRTKDRLNRYGWCVKDAFEKSKKVNQFG